MIFSNYHTHTTYCDGADKPEELILEAIRLGCPEIGFSGHSHLKEDTGSMSEQGTLDYCAEIRSLQTRYAEQIRIRLGIEHDIFSEIDHSLFDYSIGAVHWVKKEGVLYPVDESRETFCRMVEEQYGGDYYACAEDYYALVGAIYEVTHCDVIAHFDLITKYNEGNTLFDTGHPRYVAAADAALDRLIEAPVLLEVNTGAIARGYRSEPYPEGRIRQRWLDAGKELILSSDCHDRRKLLCEFETWKNIPRRETLC
ncbi:MAG: histidinol-phosphatase HisJ family protein [Oscillospiraceae bacterium]|nr:histidinol-phosphatase HisJ family protein [Oscillospiraceae bacterium]